MYNSDGYLLFYMSQISGFFILSENILQITTTNLFNIINDWSFTLRLLL